jgi:methylated-DNA-protein-cysteine methyltransferase related protein
MSRQRSRIKVREFLGASTRKSVHERSAEPRENIALQAYWDVVAMIPPGKVSTYGEVARTAGFPGRARQAGKALRLMPAGMNLPWHRVVGAGGRIVFPKSSANFREQARRLRGEGVKVTDGRVERSALL